MAVAKSYKMRTITLTIKFVRLMMIMLVFNLETQKLLPGVNSAQFCLRTRSPKTTAKLI